VVFLVDHTSFFDRSSDSAVRRRACPPGRGAVGRSNVNLRPEAVLRKEMLDGNLRNTSSTTL